jgi:peptidyl-tRNA hydrolase, PTH1 family
VILVVGLGNPGGRYADTRHNVGFRVADRLVGDACGSWREKFSGEFALVEVAGERVGVLKPQTYMNESGRSVGPAAKFYKVKPKDVVVVHDELDLPLASIRYKLGGGEAGHRGLRSISSHLSTKDYVRIRFGIGRPPPSFGGEVSDYVLQAFPLSERPQVDEAVGRSAGAVELLLKKGLSEAMNTTNQRTERT